VVISIQELPTFIIFPVMTYNNRQPFIVPNSVKDNQYYDATDPNSKEPKYVENDVPIDMNNINVFYYTISYPAANRDRVIPKDFLKLRDVSLSYSLPKKLLKKLLISELDIILSGRDLLLWTAKGNNFVDPESTSFSNNLSGEFGEFRASPTVRSFTAGLRVKF
jgi:hypothetical protein